MEADRRHTTTGVEDLKSCSQSGLDLSDLVVDRDPDALKRAGRDVDVAGPGPARYRSLDGLGEVARGAERAPRHDELCDPARPALLPELTEDALDVRLAVLVDDAGRRQLGAGIHAHVQRSLRAKAEASLGVVQLGAGDPEVEEDEVGAGNAGLLCQSSHLAEAALDHGRGRPVRLEGQLPGPDRLGIAVDPKQPAARHDPLEDLTGVPGHPQGAVDRDRPRFGHEQLYYFF